MKKFLSPLCKEARICFTSTYTLELSVKPCKTHRVVVPDSSIQSIHIHSVNVLESSMQCLLCPQCQCSRIFNISVLLSAVKIRIMFADGSRIACWIISAKVLESSHRLHCSQCECSQTRMIRNSQCKCSGMNVVQSFVLLIENHQCECSRISCMHCRF